MDTLFIHVMLVFNLRNNNLLALLLVFLPLLLLGAFLLQQQIKVERLPSDRLFNVTVRNEDDEECLPSLQNLSRSGFVQCRISLSSSPRECLRNRDFWDRQCYLNLTETVRFYHLGKGGGGTIFLSLLENGIYIQRDHPRPIYGIDQLLNGPVTTLLINIRDPVDRFVSAFNWRSFLFCQRHGELRKKYPSEVDEKDRRMHQPHLHPQEFCFEESINPKEAKIIQRLYEDDINKLAVSLCEESNSYEQAVESIKFISHAKLNLFQWLQFLVETNTSSRIKSQGLKKMMAITIEGRNGHNNSSLLEQSHEVIQELYFDHGITEEALSRLQKQRDHSHMKKVRDIMIHSSSTHNTTKERILGAIGECCLSRFLENDYQLIQSMLGEEKTRSVDGAVININRLEDVHPIIRNACEWGSKRRRQLCRADLQSMLQRRAGFLDRSVGTCRDLVSSE